jgi:hypothetical protein
MNTNSTQHYQGWHSEPRGRGTWGILSTCLLTLGLCVWTALHLNIPKKKGTGIIEYLRFLRSKLLWVLVGFFAPEVMVYMAWGQWLNARAITREVKKARKSVRLHMILHFASLTSI